MPSPPRSARSRPRVSVLFPCRDAERTLPDAIESLRVQTLEDFEVIAVDDASTDSTGAILSKWAAADPRVTVLSTGARTAAPTTAPSTTHPATPSPAPGLVPALNLAATRARAPILARMDADDIAHPARLAIQLAYLTSHPDLAGCGTHIELFPADQIRSGYRRYERWINAIEAPADVYRNALVECPIAHPTLALRRSVFRAVGDYRDMGWPEDHDLVLRVLAAGARLANVPRTVAPKSLLRWRIREDRLSLTSPTYAPAAFRRCRVHFLRHAFLPAGRDVVVWGAGRVGKPLARELIRRGTPVAAFVDLDPRKIGQDVHGARVLSPEGFGAWCRASARRPYVLAAVGSPGVRDEIRAALAGYGFEELRDFRFCA